MTTTTATTTVKKAEKGVKARKIPKDQGTIVLTPSTSTSTSTGTATEDTTITEDEYATNDQYLPPGMNPRSKIGIKATEAAIVFDLETTGLNPWDSRFVLGSFWDLREEKAMMYTIMDYSEEYMVYQIANLISELKPKWMIGFNVSFDMRWLLALMAKYQVRCPELWAARQYEIQSLLKLGAEEPVEGTQAGGTLEQWATYIYNEKKPYTIEECFAAIDAAKAEIQKLPAEATYEEKSKIWLQGCAEMAMRNRWDTGISGDIYLLEKYIIGEDISGPAEMRATYQTEEQSLTDNVVETICPYCLQKQDYDCSEIENPCVVCERELPRPSACNAKK